MATQADKELLTTAQRTVTVTADTTGYGDPRRIVQETAHQTAAGATAFGQAVLVLENVAGRMRLTRRLAGHGHGLKKGHTVALNYPRFGLGNALGLIVGADEKFDGKKPYTLLTMEVKDNV